MGWIYYHRLGCQWDKGKASQRGRLRNCKYPPTQNIAPFLSPQVPYLKINLLNTISYNITGRNYICMFPQLLMCGFLQDHVWNQNLQNNIKGRMWQIMLSYQIFWLWIHSYEYTVRCWMVWCPDECDVVNEGIAAPWEHHDWSPMLYEYPTHLVSPEYPADFLDPWIQSPNTRPQNCPQGAPLMCINIMDN